MVNTTSNHTAAPPPHGTTTATPGAAHFAVPRAVAFLAAVLLALLGITGSTWTAAADDGLIKVFVVPDPAQTGSAAVTLGSIAADTLGGSARAGEILNLNRGLTQKDGGALENLTDQLHPGWILRLPADATGAEVRLAQDTSGGGTPSASADASPGTATAGSAPASSVTSRSIPLPAVIAALGAVLLALVTAAIMGRRRLRRTAAAVIRALARLGEPLRQRRRLAARRALGERFAADSDSVQHAYSSLHDFGADQAEADVSVHALSLGDEGVAVWLPVSENAREPWQRIDATRWRRTGATTDPRRAAAGITPPMPRGGEETACLTRVGDDAHGQSVFVDLSRLDGVLSVHGDPRVARDVVQHLLAEVTRSFPGIPVTVLGGTGGGQPLAVPADAVWRPTAGLSATEGARPSSVGTAHGAAARHQVRGVAVLAGAPGPREVAELAALCGPAGAGWTGLVSGEVDGAHWRWYADARGRVEIPVLGVTLTVPA